MIPESGETALLQLRRRINTLIPRTVTEACKLCNTAAQRDCFALSI
jgi:hypothetical protein